MALEPRTQAEAEGGGGSGQITRILSTISTFIDQSRILPFLSLAVPTIMTMVGCAQTPAQKAEADMASVRQETTAATLAERGRGFASIGDHTRAEEYLAAALDAGASPRDVLPLLMEVCVRTGRYRSAIQHGENHLRKHPNDLRTRVMVGALYVAINDGKQAKSQLEHVVSKPEDVVNRAEDAANGDGAAPATIVIPPRRVEAPPAAATAAATAPSPPPSPRAEPLYAQAHYLLAVVARDTDNDVVEADRHFREYLRIEPNGSHAEEAKSSLLKRLP